MAKRRFPKPARLEGATDFAGDPVLGNEEELVRAFRQHPQFAQPLVSAATFDKKRGRKRDVGKWALAYLAFTISGHADIQPWHTNTSKSLWRACGFPKKPPYQTVYERFAELESKADAFTGVAMLLIRQARRHEPRIGNYLHIDSTESETHADLIHDCRAGDPCRQGKGDKTTRPERTTVEWEQERRHERDEKDPEANDGTLAEVIEDDDGRVRIRIGTCWYRTRDREAGVRYYAAQRKFWHGYYNTKVVDHFTGAPLAVGVFSASTNEGQMFVPLFREAVEALGGEMPHAVIGDRGFSQSAIFEHLTRAGVASVFPWRASGPMKEPRDSEEYDRYGRPRCRHCGAPGRRVRFNASKNEYRIWFRCTAGATPACDKDQTIGCSKDWRMLTPLAQEDPTYQELAAHHSEYEGAHRYWRDRYLVGADDLAIRPKRIGLGAQQLRASAALLIEWFRITYRHGWLGSARKAATLVREGFTKPGLERLEKHLAKIREAGLDRAYGAVAAALYGDESYRLPPSQRSGAPPG
jgi:hypothetical protein